jgi:uncharacterized protein (DUF488 family)
MKIYTIGHSNLKIEEFIIKLTANDLLLLIDIRAFPSSKKFPQFKKSKLQIELFALDIEYIWKGRELGGFRQRSDGLGESSPNKGWKREGFRIYADYMLSDSFQKTIDDILCSAAHKKTVLMCAEKDYRRCHRQLIADYIITKGWDVFPHAMTPFAKCIQEKLIYPDPDAPEPLLPF